MTGNGKVTKWITSSFTTTQKNTSYFQ